MSTRPILVATGDAAGLVEAATRILSDTELARQVTAAARLRVCQRFDAAEQVERVAAAYRQVLAEV